MERIIEKRSCYVKVKQADPWKIPPEARILLRKSSLRVVDRSRSDSIVILMVLSVSSGIFAENNFEPS